MAQAPRLLVVCNTISTAAMLVVNSLAASGRLTGSTVINISDRYQTLFTPASYAFGIWSVIFLLLIGFVVYQWVQLRRGDPNRYIEHTGAWLMLSNLANLLWIVCWTTNQIGLSVICILVLLVSLCILTNKLRLELDDEPVLTVLFVWWPLVIYLGWIMVATIACVASWLVSAGWRGGSFGEVFWTIAFIIFAGLLYIFLVEKRNQREAAGVGIWALVAIAVQQWEGQRDIAVAALAMSVILLLVTGYHGYRNRAYNLAVKAKRGEWR